MKALFLVWVLLLIALFAMALSGCSFRYDKTTPDGAKTSIQVDVSSSSLSIVPLLL